MDESGKNMRRKITHSYSLRHALCALRFRRGAAGEENGADRLPQRAVRASPGTGDIQGRAKRTRLGRGKKHRNLSIATAGARADKYSEFATELVRLKVDVIVAGPGNGATSAAKRVTSTIPIVMVAVIDPVSNGLVASLARPGANVTGLTLEVTREQAGKNLELLKEAVPKVSRVAILRNPRSFNAYRLRQGGGESSQGPRSHDPVCRDASAQRQRLRRRARCRSQRARERFTSNP